MLVVKETELKDVTITHVSYVKNPANKKPFFFAKTEDGLFQTDVMLVQKGDDEQRLLYGIVYEPDTVDAHGDVMSAEEIEKMAHDFVTHYRAIDHEHQLKAGVGEVVESYIAPVEFTTDAGFVIKKGTWILVTRASETAWELWKSGEIAGYSMFGVARETVAKGESKLEKLLKKLASAFGTTSKSFDETLEAELTALSRDPWFILDIMKTDWYKSIDWTSSEVDKEVLKGLAASLGEAKAYIDGLFVETTEDVSKSEDEQATEDEEPAQADDEEPEADGEDDGDEAGNEEDVTVVRAQVASILDTMSQISTGLNAITERLEALEKKTEDTAAAVEEVSKNSEATRALVDENVTQSMMRVGGEQPKKERPLVAKTVRGAELL